MLIYIAIYSRKASVLVFQKLWNANNPNSKISEDGVYGPATEAAILKALLLFLLLLILEPPLLVLLSPPPPFLITTIELPPLSSLFS